MRILILGAFGNGALENFYVRGFQKLSLHIETFDIAKSYYEQLNKSLINKAVNKINAGYFFKSINERLLQFVKEKKYDVILIFKGLTLFAETIRQLKEFTNLICCYNPDHPFTFFAEGSGNKNIVNSIKHYDIYFSYAKNISRQLKQNWGVDSYAIPFGYDDSGANDNSSPDANIYRNKFLFIGAYDSERSQWLRELNMDELNIYGDTKWESRTKYSSYIAKAYQGKPLYDAEYKTANRNAAGIINLLRKQNIIEGSHNMRTFEVPGCGGVLIANRTEEQQSFFEENKEAIYFDSIDELKSRIYYLRANPDTVLSIKQAALKRSVSSAYSYCHRSLEMHGILKKYLQ